VLGWLAEVDEDSLFLSVVTITELRGGIDRLADWKTAEKASFWAGLCSLRMRSLQPQRKFMA